MRILLVNQYFPPDTSATAGMAAALVRAMNAAHHEITVLAGRPSYDPTEVRPWRLVQRERWDGASVQRVGSTSASRFAMRGRVANYLSYAGLAMPAALSQRADAVVAMTDPPIAAMVGAIAAAGRRTPLVYWLHDFHPDFALAAGMVEPSAFTRAWQAAHRAVLSRADAVVVLGADMAVRAAAAGARPGTVHVVPNGIARPDVASGDRDHPVARQIRAGHEFVALHAGNLGFAGNWDALIEAGRDLDASESLVFVGGGADRNRLEHSSRPPPSVRFVDRQPAELVPAVYAAADLHVVSVRRGIEGLMVPSKVYDILAAGRPVLAAAPTSSEVAATVKRHRCGYVVDPDDPSAIAKAIRHAHEHPDELAGMAGRARSAAAEYDRAAMMNRVVGIIETVVAARRRLRR